MSKNTGRDTPHTGIPLKSFKCADIECNQLSCNPHYIFIENIPFKGMAISNDQSGNIVLIASFCCSVSSSGNATEKCTKRSPGHSPRLGIPFPGIRLQVPWETTSSVLRFNDSPQSSGIWMLQPVKASLSEMFTL